MSRRLDGPVLGALLVLAPAVTHAQGFSVYEQGTCTMSRAGAAAGEPCDDGSAVFVNPAGLAGERGLVFSGGATLIWTSGSFASDAGPVTDVDNDLATVPHAYVRYGITDRLAIGAGVYAPYGLRVKWPLSFEGRFVSYDTDLKTIYVQPTVAYAISDRVAVGGGLTIASGSVQLKRREDLARVPLPIAPGLTFGELVDAGTDFLDTELESSWATGVGANIGVLVKAHERLRFGVRYLTPVTLEFDGRSTFTALPGPFVVTRANALGLPVGTPLDGAVQQVAAALPDQSVATELEMPAQLVAGVSVHATPRVKIFGDYHWMGWSVFDEVRLDFAGPLPADERLVQNYEDTSALRLGTEIQAAAGLRISGGYIFNQAAAPPETVTPLLPEGRRNHLTAGLGWTVRPGLVLDLAYHYLRQDDRRGRVVNPPPGALPTVDLNSGTYHSRADLLGITLTVRP